MGGGILKALLAAKFLFFFLVSYFHKSFGRDHIALLKSILVVNVYV